MLIFQKLKSLSEQPVLGPEIAGLDKPKDIDPELFLGWRRVLSSIATTEGYEAVILRPLSEAYQEPVIQTYLKRHAEDEERHATYIKDYLKAGFDYEKRKATTSDILFYQNLIPIFAKLVTRLPMIGITILYAYEKFSLRLYSKLREKAKEHKLQDLSHIIERISRDEGFHVAGLELLKKVSPTNKGWRGILYFFLIPISLWLVRMDLYMGRFSLHNRELIEHLRKLGIDPLRIDEDARESIAFAKKQMQL